MFLTPEDLFELTEARTPRLQKAWLDSRGWVYEVSRFGKPKVLIEYAKMRLGLAKSVQQVTEPDFSALTGT